MISPSEINTLPLQPGCYLFKDETGKVLYVGKAKQLRKRVSQYFQSRDLDPKTQLLVKHIKHIDFIVTQTEVEALLLENNLIKKYYPQYNLDLKDSRRYAYLRLTTDSLPYIEVARLRDAPGEYYGPFVSGMMRRYIEDILHRYFRILTRKPSPQMRKSIDPAEYNDRVAKARQILKGNTEELITQLKKEMVESSKKTYYEYAKVLRNQILALESLKEKQHMEMTRSIDAHAINYQVIGDCVYLIVFTIRQGMLEDKQQFSFQYHEGFLDEFLLQFYTTQPIPQEVLLPHEADPALEEYLTKERGSKVSLIFAQKGDKKVLLDLAMKNLHATFFPGQDRIIDLQSALQLPEMPKIIECFDISHLSGTHTTASMVAFKDAKPNKAHYRKFKIHAKTDADDFMAMQEVVRRRYAGTLKDELPLPDLIVIDGGKGQLSAATQILQQLKIIVPVIALAKKLEEIYRPGQSDPIRLSHKRPALHLLQAIRDEAHRFALTYNRKLRSKAAVGK